MLLRNYLILCTIALSGILLSAGCRQSDDEVLAKITGPDGKISSEMYLAEDTSFLFWQIREMPGRLTLMVHEGTVGEAGRYFEVSASDQEALLKEAGRLSREAFDKGYKIYGPEAYSQIIIQTDTVFWGPIADLDKLAMVEDLINQTLVSTGNGKCSSSDIGSKVSIYAVVFEPQAASKSILKALRDSGTELPVVIAIEKGNDIQVIWPENYHGEFSLL